MRFKFVFLGSVQLEFTNLNIYKVGLCCTKFSIIPYSYSYNIPTFLQRLLGDSTQQP